MPSQEIRFLCIAEPMIDLAFAEFMIEALGSLTDYDHAVHRASRGFQVVLQLDGGHLQVQTAVGESIGGDRIRRKVADVIHVHPKQISHRVLVLGAIEPAQDDPSVCLFL